MTTDTAALIERGRGEVAAYMRSHVPSLPECECWPCTLARTVVDLCDELERLSVPAPPEDTPAVDAPA